MTSITKYVRDASEEISNGYNLQRFMELRYDRMSKECPHETFSTERAGPDFFMNALAHITGIQPLPKDEIGKPLSEYDKNYVRWIKQAQTENASLASV